jgi:hypothetical protein
MIRRDAPDAWLLISQVEHARIAAEIAEAWGNDQTPSLTQRDEFVAAVRHHDHGWAEWELAPTCNPATGRPRDFLEMPMPDATAIWTRSIDACAALSPWCGLWVSRHFCRLAEQAHQHRTGEADRNAAALFLGQQGHRQIDLRRDLARQYTPELEEAGFQWLRFFDLFSLWLCCAERTEPERLAVANVPSMLVSPRGPAGVALDPYPLASERLDASVSTIALPRREYRSDSELRTAIASAPHGVVSWSISRGGSSGANDRSFNP